LLEPRLKRIDSDITFEKFDQTFTEVREVSTNCFRSCISDTLLKQRLGADKYLTHKTSKIKQSIISFHEEILLKS